MRHARTQRGWTLVELIVVLAISAILVGMVVIALIDLARSRKPREVAAAVQGEGRSGLALIENDLRLASLGAGTGVLFLRDGAGDYEMPSVQIINDIPAGASSSTAAAINAKPGTDAILIVRAVQEPATTVGDRFASTLASVSVHGTNPAFAANDHVILGDYGDASWTTVSAAGSATADGSQHFSQDLTLTNPRIPSRTLVKLPAGSLVRRAVARLYFVSPEDELVRVDLSSPRLSAGVTVSNREVIACTNTVSSAGTPVRGCGIEDLQIGCQLDDGAAVQPCPTAAAGALADDAAALFGVTFGAAQGPRLAATATQQSISMLRTVSLSLVVRGGTPLIDTHGDPKIALGNGTRPVGVQPDAAEYVRRAYQIDVAVRNTSLGVL